MRNLNGRLRKLEAVLQCPTHRLPLTCPRCDERADKPLSYDEPCFRVEVYLQLASMRRRASYVRTGDTGIDPSTLPREGLSTSLTTEGNA
jgi:hypothetical protein